MAKICWVTFLCWFFSSFFQVCKDSPIGQGWVWDFFALFSSQSTEIGTARLLLGFLSFTSLHRRFISFKYNFPLWGPLPASWEPAAKPHSRDALPPLWAPILNIDKAYDTRNYDICLEETVSGNRVWGPQLVRESSLVIFHICTWFSWYYFPMYHDWRF